MSGGLGLGIRHTPQFLKLAVTCFKSCQILHLHSFMHSLHALSSCTLCLTDQMPDLAHPNHLSEKMLLLFRKRFGETICWHSCSWNLVNIYTACGNVLSHPTSVYVDMSELRMHRRTFLRQQINRLLVVTHD
ncbi:hypothetical protein ACN42_g2838 [Penicillium freii]|uniref:Uncharacterized protein n=1 Tax=Penicillium freii TaxID=48697 RepID=A0A101MPF7_PENFR|nr:hypothetical protein ACN42_g2838 [Penicillium freii]